MKEIINAYSHEYATVLKKLFQKTDDLRKVNHPVLFLFIGDESLEALEAVYKSTQAKWRNHDGVMYLFAYTKKSFQGENIFCFKLPDPSVSVQEYRKAVRQEFYENENSLIELNRLIRKLNGSLTDRGKYYSQFDSLNISVITRIDDPANVVIPEISVLTKKIMKESFKAVNIELYGLLKEKNQGENHHRSTAVGISFLRELQYYQSNNYMFSADLEITEDRVPLTVELDTMKLFSLVYLLSDRDEQGKTDSANMKNNFEIISTLNLLKNRSTVKSGDSQNKYYDNSGFIQGIQPGFGETAYASAGFSKVVRPNRTIAITVLHRVYSYYLEKTKAAVKLSKPKIMSLLGIDEETVNSKIQGLVPDKQLLEKSGIGLMKNSIPFQTLKGLTLRRAENELLSNSYASTFTKTFTEPAFEGLKKMNVKEELLIAIKNKVMADSNYGLYCASIWTDEEDEESGIIQELRNQIKNLRSEIDKGNAQIEADYENIVEKEGFKWSTLPLSEKKNKENFIKHLITKIYGNKLNVLKLEVKLEYLKQLEEEIVEVHDLYKRQIEQVEELDQLLYQMTKNVIEIETDYLSRNIYEYYSKVVKDIIREFEEKRGEHFYFDDRFFGNISFLLENGMEEVLAKFIAVCRKEILPHFEFNKTVEDELLDRSNLDVKFDNNEVLTKHGLFKELYSRLNHYSITNIDISEATVTHRYEEKYFFGDYQSEFIQWAFNYDVNERTYKLGCIHEERSSEIEKLTIMGGFKLSDLRYWINNYQNYEHYCKIGFSFHGIDETLLPTTAENYS